MNKTTEALKMAIEALEDANGIILNGWSWVHDESLEAIQACKEALAEAEKQSGENIRQSFDEMLEDKVAYYKGKQPAQTEYVVNSGGTGTELRNPAQEPVAWLSENSSQVTKWKDIAQSWIQHGGKAIPLYTQPAPQPAQEPVACSNKYGCKCDKHYTHPAPAREPLNNETVRAEFRAYVDSNLDVDDGFRFVDFLEGVRWAEQAHGIGVKDENNN